MTLLSKVHRSEIIQHPVCRKKWKDANTVVQDTHLESALHIARNVASVGSNTTSKQITN